MKELEKAMKIAQEAFDEALFKAAVETAFDVTEFQGQQKDFIVKNYDIPFAKKNGLRLPTWTEVLDDDDERFLEYIEEIEKQDMELVDSIFMPNKEARRRTRKENRKHKTYDVCGHSYKRYGKDKQVGKQYREERLYNSGFKTKRTTVLFQEYDNDTEIPALADVDKGEYRIINGYAYPSDYITDEEYELIIQAARMSEYGHTDTGKICGIIFFAEISNDGRGILTVKVMTEAEILYQGKNIERAKEIFNVLTKNN